MNIWQIRIIVDDVCDCNEDIVIIMAMTIDNDDDCDDWDDWDGNCTDDSVVTDEQC